MSLVIPDSSEIVLLQYLLNMTTQTHPVLKLYKNDHTPSESTVIGSLTQADQAGYASITLAGTSWTTTQVSGVTTGVYSEQTFTFTTGATVYGYYVTTTAGTLLWVERFPGAPFVIPDGGGQIAVTSKITLD